MLERFTANYLKNQIIEALMKKNLLTFENARYLLNENTTEIDFSMLDSSKNESAGYFLTLTSARCPKVRAIFYG